MATTVPDEITLVKVFSTTKARDREMLGERITSWLQANPDVRILETTVALTSDRAFHCLSIVLICGRAAPAPPA